MTVQLSVEDVKFLVGEISRMKDILDSKGGAWITAAARREACILQLNLSGYRFDTVAGKAYKERGNVRTYVE